MENKEITSEIVTAKEWKNLSVKTFNQVNKKLWTKGRIRLGLGVVIICILVSIVDHMGDRYERNFDRGYGMMQGRESMMWNSRRWGDRFQQRGFRDMKWIQGCSQQATVEVDPANSNTQIVRSQVNCPFADQMNSDDSQKADGFFGRIETRMKQMFGSDKKWDIQVTVPEATIVVSTGSSK